jgi:Zn-dependent protease
MRWSIPIARIAGIRIYMHLTFLILLAWIAFTWYSRGRSPDERLSLALRGIGFTLATFGIVVLHELGHAMAARMFGVRTRDIILLPIGGVARLERMPDKPWQELIVAVAGPAVNVVLFAAGASVLAAQARLGEILAIGDPMRTPLLPMLTFINAWLVIFNLIPAFPMDGGRCLRALLAMAVGQLNATRLAARLGRAFAVLFAILGLAWNPFLALIALFVWLGAGEEARVAELRAALSGIPVRNAMITRYVALPQEATIGQAAQLVLEGFQADFPVVREGRPVGLLTRGAIVQAVARGELNAPVAGSLSASPLVADPAETLEHVLARLQVSPFRTALVLQDGALAGLITLDNIGEYVMLQDALREGGKRAPGQVRA